MATIQIIDRATGPLNQLQSKFSQILPGLMIAGRSVRNLLQAHFREKEGSPNKLGGERQHFWLQVAHAVNNPQPTGPAQVTVSISHPAIMQKIMGGTITAKRAKNLTIPMRPEAYGRTAAMLERALGIKLFVIAKGGRAYLAGREGGKDNAALRVFYALKRSVNQQPDPSALPPQRDMEEVAKTAFGNWVMGTYQT